MVANSRQAKACLYVFVSVLAFLPAHASAQASEASEEEKKQTGKTDDPVRLYLRDMGAVELLSREGEIAIAKRIEAGKDVMLNALSQSPLTAHQIFEWDNKLQKDEILVREIIDIDTNYMEYENIDQNVKPKDSNEDTKEKLEDNNENNEDDEFNPTLAAMETEIKPKVLQTINILTKDYNKLIKYQKEKLDCVLKSNTFSNSKEKNYQKIVGEILKNIKTLQLSPSVLEELVQKHYIENKKIVSLEGNLLRMAINNKISRNEFIKFYVDNEINPNLKKFLDLELNITEKNFQCNTQPFHMPLVRQVCYEFFLTHLSFWHDRIHPARDV